MHAAHHCCQRDSCFRTRLPVGRILNSREDPVVPSRLITYLRDMRPDCDQQSWRTQRLPIDVSIWTCDHHEALLPMELVHSRHT